MVMVAANSNGEGTEFVYTQGENDPPLGLLLRTWPAPRNLIHLL